MRPFERILFFPGGEAKPSRALRRALHLAERSASRLTVLEVLPDLPLSVRTFRLSVEPEREPSDVLRTVRKGQVEEMVAKANKASVPVEVDVVYGDPFVEITRRVIRDGHDLVMKSALGDEGSGAGIISGTGLHLIRKCPCPVWVLKREARDVPPRVLAAVDPAEEDEEAKGLSRKVLDVATALSESEGGELHVAHAWWLWAESTLRGPRLKVPDREMAKLLASTRDRAAEGLASLLDEHGVDPDSPTVHLVRGQPADAIVALADELEVDLIVMGTVSRGGVRGLLIGNTAERVLRRVHCSVMAVKPDGFRSPLS